jgi:hypothetical protein
MDKRILFGITLTLAIGILRATTFAQAAAESALGTAHSASSTVGATSALNRALNQSGKQLAGRVQEQMPQGGVARNQQQLKLKKGISARAAHTDSVPGNVVTSIQGAQVTCAPANPKPQTPAGKPNTESRHTNCPSNDLSVKAGPEAKYKSVITLPPPK